MKNQDKIHPESVFKTILAYIRPMRVRNTIGVFCLLVYSLLAVQIPVFVKDVINNLEQGTTLNEVFYSCLYILAFAAMSGALLFFARWAVIGASRIIETNLRNDFFAHIQKLTPRFYQHTKTGDLVTRFASDIEQARLLLGPGIMYPGQTTLVTGISLYYMFSLNVEITLTLLIPIVILMVHVNLNTRKLHKIYRQAQDIYSDLTAHVQENFSGIRVIKAYAQEEAEYQRFKQINDRYVSKNIEQIKLRGRLHPFMQYIAGVGVILILWRGGIKVIEGELTLGALVQFSIYYQMLIWPIIALGWIINVIHRGTASWKRIHAIMSTPPEIFDAPEIASVPKITGEIEVRNLTFSYTELSPPAIENLSFHVHPGQTLGIIGSTGCGKSTIVNLLLHLYALPRGHVFIDGVDINDIPIKELRESIAYVSQDVFLFSDTIRSNILFGVKKDGEISDETLHAAANQAQIMKDLSAFPDKFETEVGERGITLSGGQKQRIGIARALILHRPILILDDSLSSVDADTEEAIFKGLQEEMIDRTAIVISHRISTVKNANHIIVLDEGKVIEEGTHQELLHNKGLYATTYRRQLLETSLGIRS